MPLFLRLPRCAMNRCQNPRVRPAAAYIAVHSIQNLLLGRMRVFAEQGCRGHNHSRRAIAALKCALFKKSLLDRIQRAMLLESLNRRDLRIRGGRGRRQAGPNGVPIEQDRAGAALPLAAAIFGASQVQTIP